MITNKTRERLLLILELLYRKSDERHPISSVEISNYLDEKGIPTDRKTLATDMKLLMSRDYDLIMIKSSPNKFFIGSRALEVPELKLLIDAVSSSRFITDKKSKELIKKLKTLCSEPQAEELSRHVIAAGRVKADNRNIYYIVDTITDAINERKKIKFQITDYNGLKKKILKNDGEEYIVSPYTLYWNEDYYYVIGYSDKHENISAFRVDRLANVKVIDEKRKPRPKDFKARDYADKIFSMYAGECETVELECENSLMKYIIDRFGIDVETEPVEGTNPESPEGRFKAKVEVALTPTFYGWVFQFGGKIRILGPEKVWQEIQKMIDKIEE